VRYRLSFTTDADADLDRIRDWLATNASAATAAAHLRRIRDKAAALRKFPKRGPLRDAATHSMRVPQTPYILVYRVLDDRVQVIRIFHDRQNWRDTP